MIKSYQLTLTGSVQRLSSIYSTDAEADQKIKALILQPRGTNANSIFVGTDPATSSTVYGWRLEAGATGVPPAPFILGEMVIGGFRLSELYVLGTNTEVLNVTVVK